MQTRIWAGRWVGSTATPADAHDRYSAKVQEDRPSRAGSKPPSRRTCPRISTEEQGVQFCHKIIWLAVGSRTQGI